MFLKLNRKKRNKPKTFSLKFSLLLATSLLFLPSFVMAAGGANVELNFTNSDKFYLYLSLAFGLLALLAGLFLSRSVLKVSPGNEKMRSVGQAIREGALAYLKKQVAAMLVFVVLIAVGLHALYVQTYGSNVAMAIALSFVAGVAASYIAGYTGMLMAVSGNMRTANAALSSYKTSLETAFRSGGVAGLVTVGMGLIGATLIFLFTGNDAMKVLIGFGFGGSLAALFMRVGGGIYTKAADVGADLVGKVEAGIPEDDPRNPATIADNVGDNVGDCAGMAADVFESYEVTLVAAIVLGAATASIFDQATWMRLILFALMARGVGILASIFGIFSVRGTNDIKVDPLQPIRKGFIRSAVIATVGTAIAAWFMMGGSSHNPIKTSLLIPFQELQNKDIQLVREVQNDIATKKKIAKYEVTTSEIQADPKIKAAKLDTKETKPIIDQALALGNRELPVIKNLNGYSKVNFNDSKNQVLNYAVISKQAIGPGGQPIPNAGPTFVDLKKDFSGNQLELAELKITHTPPTPPAERGKPKPVAPAPQTTIVTVGPVEKTFLDKQLQAMRERKITCEVLQRLPMTLYADKNGNLVTAVDKDLPGIYRATPITQIRYYKQSAEKMNQLLEARQKDPSVNLPQIENASSAVLKQTTVEWWRFVACVVFGILMAFAIEMLTDYYVSTHKKPVQEIANVATAGPAPMIIQGFAYGKESSVYSVFAIVLALIMPLFIFPPSQFGGYILSFYGIALVGLGLLTTTGYILAMDTFGPISDNAQGIFEMSGATHENPTASRVVQHLDAAGNTTKALTKGFAIATAVVAAVALFHSYVADANLSLEGLRIEVPEIFLGLLLGGATPYLFSAFTINAVGRAAFELINEVRRQFHEDSGIMKGTSKPNYARCVAIVTKAAQRELVGPGILAIALPVIVAFGFSIGKPHTIIGDHEFNLVGAQALGGFLAGAILSGQLLAVLLANAGGMWDNAKKLIEDGLHGGKGSEAHKAGVVVDTVGDPFKDTAGPALNPLIKVMNLVALLLAPIIILPLSNQVLSLITAGGLALFVGAIWWSKRSSLAQELSATQKTVTKEPTLV